MGMVVRSNLMAMNANRQLGMNNSSVSKSLEKLSSGFKINRAGDDASGLAISEKMKAQIKGLEQASANSQDGISLVQTAEGALTEVHDMLNRMTELATKSANGTIQDEVDRDAIQSEVDALLSEIDRIGDSTNFNGISLLDGSLSEKGGTKAVTAMKISGVTTGEKDAVKGKYTVTAGAPNTTIAAKDDVYNYTVTYMDGNKEKTVNFSVTQKMDEDGKYYLEGSSGEKYKQADSGSAVAASGDIYGSILEEIKKNKGITDKFAVTDTSPGSGAFVFEAREAGKGGAQLVSVAESCFTKSTGATTYGAPTVAETTPAVDASKTITLTELDKIVYTGPTGTVSAKDAVFTVNGKKFAVATTNSDVSALGKDVNVIWSPSNASSAGTNGADIAAEISKQTGLEVTVGTDAGGNQALVFNAGSGSNGSGGLTLQIGDTGDDFNMVKVNVEDMRSKSLGVAGLDVSTADSARSSIETIKGAINMVSTNRANLGALQNRLEHTINNLDVAAENMTAANSRIRDTDMAKQMMDYTKMNVLTQSAQAMLAQANQQPQSILQLLQ